MKEELLNKPVLAMYDVRGIQSYIFRTNRVQEIMGASRIVENIMIRGLKKICEDNQFSSNEYIVDWNTEDVEFLSNESIKMQVMYIGGGNAYVLFRSGEICQTINRALARFVFENTYSLQLAVAVVEKTEDYGYDYNQVKLEMRRVKSEMPDGRPVGAFPFMKVDAMTGFPIVKESDDEFRSTESVLKIKAYVKSVQEGEEKILDNLTEKEDSILAVVHIDGNSMGLRIGQIMRSIPDDKKKDYSAVTRVVRGISQSIDTSFKESFKSMCDYIDQSLPKLKLYKGDTPYRKIICAGDDITFICNAKVVLEAVKFFLLDISKKYLSYYDETEAKVSIKEPFSACAGIAIIHSHFPFSDAYQVAEACCDSAKKVAKSKENLGPNGEVGNYLDFQVCGNINAADLTPYRKKHYTVDENLIISRPYKVVDGGNPENFETITLGSVDELIYLIRYFTDADIIPRSQAKQLREEFTKGKESKEAYMTFLKSRQRTLPNKQTKDEWYDALELMDYYVKPM